MAMIQKFICRNSDLRRQQLHRPGARALRLDSLTILFAGLSIFGAAAEPSKSLVVVSQIDDPAERLNRSTFRVNQFVDDVALQPIARGYKTHVPERMRTSVRNFVSNLSEPNIIVNDLLQGNLARARNTSERLAINTTIGGAGLLDVAGTWGRPAHHADHGQTFGVWGVAPGPAVQLPLFGASNVRDSVGKFAGSFVNPTSYLNVEAFSTVELVADGLEVIDGRSQTLEKTDVLVRSPSDYYASLRAVAAKRREKLVSEGRAGLIAE